MIGCLSLPLTNLAQLRKFLDAYAMEARFKREERFTRQGRLIRMRRFLELLGQPQNQLKVIHVAGTTGKGSTCIFIEALLRTQGKTTGLSLSPHAIDVRERFQLNGTLVSEDGLIDHFRAVKKAVQMLCDEPCGIPTYVELLMGTAFFLFAKAQVEYAVIETSMGGHWDASNTVEREDKLCVITKIGIDHVQILGETVEEIAQQKMGIVQRGNDVVLGIQELITQGELEDLANVAGAHRVLRIEPLQTEECCRAELIPYLYQDALLAQRVCEHVAERDGWLFQEGVVRQALLSASLPLRFERITWHGKTVILDAAHNPQKIQGLVEALAWCFPGEAYACACAFNPGTDVLGTGQPLLMQAARFACIDFVNGTGQYRFRFIDPGDVRTLLEPTNQEKKIEMLFERSDLLSWIRDVPEKQVVITGSFHFAAAVRALLLGLPDPW